LKNSKEVIFTEVRSLNIVVCVKTVPNTNEVKIDKKTNNLVRVGIPSIINPFDEHGIEEALRIREKFGGKVTAISMGIHQASETLEHCLRLGVDEAILLTDKALQGSDTLATGYALSVVISKKEFDLVICGAEAIDSCTGQVGPIIAENLGLPHFTYVKKIVINNKNITVYREVQGGLEILESKLPVVVCVVKGINELLSLPTHKTNRSVIVLNAEEAKLDKERIGIDGSSTRVINICTSTNRAKSYVEVDSSLSAAERIKFIINGGVVNRPNSKKLRGTASKLAKLLWECPCLQKYLT